MDYNFIVYINEDEMILKNFLVIVVRIFVINVVLRNGSKIL